MRQSILEKFSRIILDHSTRVQPGDRVAITTTTAAEPLVQVLYRGILERGAFPHVLFTFRNQEKILHEHAQNEQQLEYVTPFERTAFGEFDVLVKVRAEPKLRQLENVDPQRQKARQRSTAQLIQSQMERGATGALRWVSTLFPTSAYAAEAGMSAAEYQDFYFKACHADQDTSDPLAYWEQVRQTQQRYVDMVQGHDRIEIRGPNADLTLSVRGRTFNNSHGRHNLPDGEIYTGPVENSANGWVRYTYPAVYNGRVVEGIELTFKDGKVIQANAKKNQDFLRNMLDIDPGARYLGEFAIGTNFEINRFTGNILLDEKIGGSFHMALGNGYPETGSVNRSMIHWDMICDLRQDSEIKVDGEIVYRNGKFVS